MREPDKYIYDVEKKNVAKYLLGRSIVATGEHGVKLDDGTELEFCESAECCAWFDYDIKYFDAENNVVTRVEEVDVEGEYSTMFKIVVFALDKSIMEINVCGEPGSGYYGSSIEMEVFLKK